ncbi:MAG: alkaline phosphatase [Anaerolineaceae bacterium]|nr:alkaline phosphatase [Anaerolineaceae bacterium]
MIEWAQGIIADLGYSGIGVLMFIETLFPPIPSEVIMPLAGFTAAQGDLTGWGIVVAGITGSTIGMLPLYYLGRAVGEERLKRWVERHGGALLTVDDIEKAEGWLHRHGGKAIFLSHILPGVRSLISIPSGYIEMNLVKFILLTILGKGVWITFLAVIGMVLGENYGQFREYFQPVSIIVTAAIVVYIIYWAVKRIRSSQS